MVESLIDQLLEMRREMTRTVSMSSRRLRFHELLMPKDRITRISASSRTPAPFHRILEASHVYAMYPIKTSFLTKRRNMQLCIMKVNKKLKSAKDQKQ